MDYTKIGSGAAYFRNEYKSPFAVRISIDRVKIWISAGAPSLTNPGRIIAVHRPSIMILRKDWAEAGWRHVTGLKTCAEKNKYMHDALDRLAWIEGANNLFMHIQGLTKQGELPTWEPIIIGPVRIEFAERNQIRGMISHMVEGLFQSQQKPVFANQAVEVSQTRIRRWRKT